MLFKLRFGLFMAFIAVFLFACSPASTTVEPDAAAVVEEAPEEVVEVAVEESEEEEMAEETMEEESEMAMEAEEEMAEEVMEEDASMAMAATTYVISAADSTVAWRGAKAIGDFHTGEVDLTDGSLVIEDGALVSGEFALDMTSIIVTDGAPDRLVQHLNSDDFFSTATFPTATLVINSAEALGDDQYAVSGDLTIKGITNPIEFTATAVEEGGSMTASADIVFDRSLYDVRFGSGSFFSDLGDDLINDEIEITVDLVASHGAEMGMEMDEEAEMAEETMEEESDMAMAAITYGVSAAESNIAWRGAKAIGDFHTGEIDITDGSLVIEDGALVSGEFTIDMTSIIVTDGAPDRLVQHLNSDDFFSTATFPTATLVINSAEALGDDQYAVVGDLTIKGITNPIEFTATAVEEGGSMTASADIVFDRSLYDVRFGSGSFFSDLGDDLINDEIELSVDLVASHGAEMGMEMDEETEMADETMEEESDMAMAATTYGVSAAESNIAWRGAKAIGDFHTGEIDITDGSLVIEDGALVSGEFTIDMTSIVATDGAPDRLIQHLNSDDFFSTATFPTATLVINSAEALGDDQYAVSGDLTIKGITNPIEFTAIAVEESGSMTAAADIVFDRSLYDVRFGSGSFFSDLGDDLINDEIELSVSLVATQ